MAGCSDVEVPAAEEIWPEARESSTLSARTTMPKRCVGYVKSYIQRLGRSRGPSVVGKWLQAGWDGRAVLRATIRATAMASSPACDDPRGDLTFFFTFVIVWTVCAKAF